MLFLLESSVCFQGQENRAAYLYAAATLPQYRSRGIMGGMIRFAADFCRSAGFHSIVLVPAEESLFGYYGRSGFKTAFYGAYESFRVSEHTGPAAAVLPVDIPEMERTIGRGYRYFGAGGALGFDTLAAQTVLE